MIKSELVTELARKRSILHSKAEETVNVIFAAMTEALAEGGRIEVRGFGTFCLREYSSFTGRNPKTGEAITVKPKKLPYFKAGKELQEKLAGKSK